MTLFLGATDRFARVHPEYPAATTGMTMPTSGFSVLRGLYRSLAQPMQRAQKNSEPRSLSSNLKGNK